MKILYTGLEKGFEKVADVASTIFGNSLTFLLAVILVGSYLFSEKFYLQNSHEIIGDIILCITFLSFFIVQKIVNRFSTSLQIKLNELIASSEKASNRMVNIESKTEAELRELANEYGELAGKSKQAPESTNTDDDSK